jgi:hypothetical protein
MPKEFLVHWTNFIIKFCIVFVKFVSAVRHDRQNLDRFCFRTDTRFVFCIRKLIKTDFFFTKTTKHNDQVHLVWMQNLVQILLNPIQLVLDIILKHPFDNTIIYIIVYQCLTYSLQSVERNSLSQGKKPNYDLIYKCNI